MGFLHYPSTPAAQLRAHSRKFNISANTTTLIWHAAPLNQFTSVLLIFFFPGSATGVAGGNLQILDTGALNIT